MNARTQFYNLSLLRVLALGCAIAFLVGCGAIKNSLKPWVCDCEPEKFACADGSVPEAMAVEEIEEPEEPEEGESFESADGPSDEKKRQHALLEATEFVVSDAMQALDEELIDELESDFGLKSEIAEGHSAFVGPMSRKGERALAVLKPGDEIRVYVDGGKDAEREWKAKVAPQSYVNALERPANAAKMVDDGRLELVIQEVHENDDGTATVEIAVYKVIGIAVARVFAHPVADRAEDGSWAKTHDLRILNGERARWIEVTPVDGGDASIYRWNHWEGMFRVPRPVPTAPRKKDGKGKQEPVSRLPEAANQMRSDLG